MERANIKDKTGVFTGKYAINMLTNEKMPIYVGDFVLIHFGTGALVGVPGHDKHDFEFAQAFNLSIKRVVVGPDGDKLDITKIDQVQENEGVMVNSGFLNGLNIEDAIERIKDYLEKKGYVVRQKGVKYSIQIIKNLRDIKDVQPNPTGEIFNISNKEKLQKKIETGLGSIFFTKQYKINQIYNINCLELMKNIRDNSIELIFADPPYNLSGSNFKMKFKKSGGADLNTNKGQWDHYGDIEFEEFTRKWLTECFRILKPNGSIWVAGSYHNIYLTGYLMKKLGFEILNEILWHKSDATPNLSCTRFVADHENFIWARKGKGNIFNYDIMKKLNDGKQMRSIWTRGKTAGGKRIHPTQKPEWLLERIVMATSKTKNIVFDPFMGSGTTAVVAKKYGRKYLGSELDRDYFKKAIERINQTTCQNII